jgi:hypothetical protein
MFKILVRTLIILAAFAAVSLGLYWFAGTSAGQTLFSSVRGGEHGRPPMERGARPEGGDFSAEGRPARGFEGGFERGGREGGIDLTRALVDLPAKLALFTGVAAVIIIPRKLFGLVKRKSRPAAAQGVSS